MGPITKIYEGSCVMQIKYFQQDVTARGLCWRFQPKPYLKEAIEGLKGVTFYTRDEAESYSRQIHDLYEKYLHNKHERHQEDVFTVDGLIAFYYTTPEFIHELSPSSQRSYKHLLRSAQRCLLDNGRKPFGRLFFKHVDRKRAADLFLQIKLTVSPHRAKHCVKVLKRVWYIGEAYNKGITTNPFKKLGIKDLPSRKRRWKQEEIHKFIETADSLGYHGMGTLALLCWRLAQRPGDMRNLKWENLNEGRLGFTQQKTKVNLNLKVLGILKERLEDVVRSNSHDYIINHVDPRTSKSHNYHDERLYNKHRRIILQAAGLPEDLWLADLRRTRCTEMVIKGMTDDQIRSVSGHQTRDVVKIYTIVDEETSDSTLEQME